jgi:hypothetical protein
MHVFSYFYTLLAIVAEGANLISGITRFQGITLSKCMTSERLAHGQEVILILQENALISHRYEHEKF